VNLFLGLAVFSFTLSLFGLIAVTARELYLSKKRQEKEWAAQLELDLE